MPTTPSFGARESFEQVKQCANSAKARGGASGRSSRAASCAPRLPGNWIFSEGMAPALRVSH
jgi:hypothetical protein